MEQLIVDQPGVFVRKKSERIRVEKQNEVLAEVPLLELEQVLIAVGGVGLSSDVIRECAGRGISIAFLSARGNPYATLISAELTGTVATRREQLLAYRDGRGLALAKAFVQGKLANQVNLLRYVAKYRRSSDPAAYEELRRCWLEVQDAGAEIDRLGGGDLDAVRAGLMGIEGRAAQRYWQGLAVVIPAAAQWPGRRQRGATDLVNSLLNYGYGIMYAQVERALILAGLDPYGGFLHGDRPGKPSLTLDLIEEFRQMVVDRTVLALLGWGVELRVDESGRLDEATRKVLAERIFERLESDERYEGQRQKLRTILQRQARHIATFVRGERAAYKPWVGRW